MNALLVAIAAVGLMVLFAWVVVRAWNDDDDSHKDWSDSYWGPDDDGGAR